MRFEVFMGADTRWYWRLQTEHGETIADSGRGYDHREAAVRGIALVQRANDAPIYEMLIASQRRTAC